MNREQATPQKIHFHMHWMKTDRLDREGFHSHNEALSRALQLAQPVDVFAIEEVSESCRLCDAKDTSP